VKTLHTIPIAILATASTSLSISYQIGSPADLKPYKSFCIFTNILGKTGKLTEGQAQAEAVRKALELKLPAKGFPNPECRPSTSETRLNLIIGFSYREEEDIFLISTLAVAPKIVTRGGNAVSSTLWMINRAGVASEGDNALNLWRDYLSSDLKDFAKDWFSSHH